MTTDITELALLVSKAKASVFTLEYISQFEPADIDSDDVDLRFEVDGRDTGTNVSIVDECGQAAKVIGALVEALEKAQRTQTCEHSMFWDASGVKRCSKCDLPEHANVHYADAAEMEIAALRQRIAELESRTVTVKLLDCDLAAVQHMSGGSKDYCNGFVDGTQNAIRAMVAAGVDVREAE
ncbi:ead/Ea22-like family protein [Klebsiella pneumoniae]|uniref:ead/Ea22-like family protein n=1 Tax=Klebsiella pneumoniae TaxID=573 RepID=UPI00351CF775